MSKSIGIVDRGMAKELAATLQNAALPPAARIAAAESIYALSKTEPGCATLCSSGGLHAIFLALKESAVPADVLRLACKVLCGLYKFDGKIVAVVARLQGGIKALIEAVREHAGGGDLRLLQWLLCALSDLSHSHVNSAAVVAANGVPTVLATLLAHLRVEQVLVPCLYVLINVTRAAAHVPTVVQEGGVPAVLAGVLAHVDAPLPVKTGLVLLRAIALDGSSVLSFAVDGAFRILLAVMHAHGRPGSEHLEIVRLASGVLWRLYLAKHPHALRMLRADSEYRARDEAAAAAAADGGQAAEAERAQTVAAANGDDDDDDDDDGGVGGGNSSSAGDEEDDEPSGRQLRAGSCATAPAFESDADADGVEVEADGDGDNDAAAESEGARAAAPARPARRSGHGGSSAPGSAAAQRVGTAAVSELLPRALMVRGGPAHLDTSCAEREPTHSGGRPQGAEAEVRCLVHDAERLVHPAGLFGRPTAASALGGRPLPGHCPHAPWVVFDSLAAAEGSDGADGGRPEGGGNGGGNGGGSGNVGGGGGGGSAAAQASLDSAGFAPPLRFRSSFESANLRRALRVREREYDLVLNADVNTHGHTQWFYFEVKGLVAGAAYKLNILNMLKTDSLFAHGMRPLLYSTRAARESGVGWRRCGEQVCYYRNELPVRAVSAAEAAGSAPPAGRFVSKRVLAKERLAESACCSTLTFTVTLSPHEAAADGGEEAAAEEAEDSIYIAQCYPYTHSQLLARVEALQRAPAHAHTLRVETLCTTIAGHAVPLLSISNYRAVAPDELRARQVVVLTARVHPGETNASWMVDGVVDALLADSEDARALRSRLVFKVIPCLNPDGVILGNYRCGLSGEDLNRSWASPSALRHPTIAHTKALLRELADADRLLMFCDLHGHSRKKGTFMYGVEGGGGGRTAVAAPAGGSGSGSAAAAAAAGAAAAGAAGGGRLYERVFPLVLGSLLSHFAYADCSFKVLRSKESTGRVVAARSFALATSYTLEASFCGPDGAQAGESCESHYSIADLRNLGATFVQALQLYTHPSRAAVTCALAQLEAMHPAKDGQGGSDDEGDGALDESKRAGARRAAKPGGLGAQRPPAAKPKKPTSATAAGVDASGKGRKPPARK